MKIIDKAKIKKLIPIEKNDQVVLIGLPDSLSVLDDDAQRNIYRINSRQEIIWQIEKYEAFQNSTFTNIYMCNGNLLGYNFDGGEYQIDIETGKIKTSQLLR